MAAALIELRDTFAAALNRYRAGDFDKAQALWSDCARLAPNDYATKLFMERLQQLKRDGVPANWDGVWNLRSK